jgi:hypothetical protein
MNKSIRGLIATIVVSSGVVGAAQAADPYPAPAYPQQYPQPYPQAQYPQQLGAQPNSMRSVFASTVASVAQSTGSAAIVAVADGLTGALKNWFDNRRQKRGTNGALGANYPAPMSMPAPMPMPGPGGIPQPGDPNNYPPTNEPAWNSPASAGNVPPPNSAAPNGNDGGYPPTNYPNVGYPDPGYPPAGDANTPPAAPPGQLYAGIAYEIHLLQPDGSTAPVDIERYPFRTGDQFRVYYRPSLPGRVDVYNINPAGQQAQIDSSKVASGELASLGPYQFTDLEGDETLILRLTPCLTPALFATTRSIVKVQGAQPGYTSDPLGIGDCNAPATRGLRTKTRDIRKVTVEGGTSFALDPIAPTELGAGDMSPRQVTITLHHR